VGRLAPEKNLGFLSEAMAVFLEADSRAHILIAGEGPSKQEIQDILSRHGQSGRLHITGVLDPSQLADAYHAMDVFAFASKSETQGMVLTEAMAAGVPIVALDASGVREVVRNETNGRLLHEETPETFAAALKWLADLPSTKIQALRQGALETAESFSMPQTAARAIARYETLRKQAFVERSYEFEQWQRTLHLIETEWEILKGIAESAGAAFFPSKAHKPMQLKN
jgi:glycosyltransferase involved in cell wall biosynthesis